MTIKEATKKMLWEIKNQRTKENGYKAVTNKDLALTLNLTAASFSRLITGVTTPQIMTWAKICKMHSLVCGTEETNHIVNKIECV